MDLATVQLFCSIQITKLANTRFPLHCKLWRHKRLSTPQNESKLRFSTISYLFPLTSEPCEIQPPPGNEPSASKAWIKQKRFQLASPAVFCLISLYTFLDFWNPGASLKKTHATWAGPLRPGFSCWIFYFWVSVWLRYETMDLGPQCSDSHIVLTLVTLTFKPFPGSSLDIINL